MSTTAWYPAIQRLDVDDGGERVLDLLDDHVVVNAQLGRWHLGVYEFGVFHLLE